MATRALKNSPLPRDAAQVLQQIGEIRYERLDDAELACGLLRYNGIACELSPLPLPGLPADIILWVHNRDAELAWALLADAERDPVNKNIDGV